MTHFWGVELDPSFSFDQRRRKLHDDGFDGVSWGPALRGHQLHAEGATVQDVAAVKNWMDHPNKRRFERKCVLEMFKTQLGQRC